MQDTVPACPSRVSLGSYTPPAAYTAHSLLLPLSHRAGALFLSHEVLHDSFSVLRVAAECLESTLLKLLVSTLNDLALGEEHLLVWNLNSQRLCKVE